MVCPKVDSPIPKAHIPHLTIVLADPISPSYRKKYTCSAIGPLLAVLKAEI
jgi:hypothetical protein